MKQFRDIFIGFIIATIFWFSISAVAKTNFSDIGSEALWNRVFDSSTNTISVIGV